MFMLSWKRFGLTIVQCEGQTVARIHLKDALLLMCVDDEKSGKVWDLEMENV